MNSISMIRLVATVCSAMGIEAPKKQADGKKSKLCRQVDDCLQKKT